jgi:ParB family chromosome partitioning protein
MNNMTENSKDRKMPAIKQAGKSKGLGKGLGALLQTIEMPDDQIKDSVMELKITDITPNSDQPRKRFEQNKLEELSASIKENGIIQPIIVCRNSGSDGYRIVAGERRWRAARLAGLKVIPAIVRDLTNLQILEHALIENIQRQDLNPIEEADALDKLIKEHNLTQEKLASVVGKSRPAIANTLRLLNLPDIVKRFVINEELSAGHARALLAIQDNDLISQVAETVIQKDLSVRETENYVKNLDKRLKNKKSKPNPSDAYLLSIQSVENDLTKHLGTKVKLKDRQGKGSIVIDYYSNEELERLIELLKI